MSFYDFERLSIFGTPSSGSGMSGGSGIDHTVQLNRMEKSITRILKRVKNRHLINIQQSRELFYEDDNTAILQINDLKDGNGDAVTSGADIVESVPSTVNDD